MKMKILAVLVNIALVATVAPAMADQGPSTAVAPYLLPMIPGAKITSILTTGEFVGGYKMGGIPDGLGAFDNGNGTFTVLMNHEIFANSGEAPLGKIRAHGGTGAYVSMWVIDRNTLAVQSGEDLMKRVYQLDASTRGGRSGYDQFVRAVLLSRPGQPECVLQQGQGQQEPHLP
jgi:hypothetical protein